jgi:DNA-binding transcriptional ArsR family regulator
MSLPHDDGTRRRDSDSLAHDADTLLDFFKALADPNRLRIVGLLAQTSRTVEDLAATLGTSNGTASHHLKRLAAAGLVEARPEGYYRYYSLREDALHEMAARLLGPNELPRLADDVDLGAFERKVLGTFTDRSGRITALPAQQKKFLVILRHVLPAFEAGRRYPEPAVNAILERYHEDTARLRRALVDHGYMEREAGGSAYWLTDDGVAAQAGR